VSPPITSATGANIWVISTIGPLTLVPPRLELSRLGDEAVALGAVELALADAETRLLPAPGYPG